MNDQVSDKHFVAEVHQDRKSIRLSMGKSELTLDAAELDVLIREIGMRRSMMDPPIPTRLDPNPRFVPVSNAAFVSGVQDMERKVAALLFRHPGYGWQGYVYHVDQLREVVKTIETTLRQIEPIQLPKSRIIMP